MIVVCYPVLLFYVTAFMTYNPFVRTDWLAQLLNILLLEAATMFLLAFCGSAVVALRILTGTALLVSLLNSYVLLFRGSPLVPWDLWSIQTAWSVAGRFRYVPNMQQIVCTLLLLTMFAGAGWLKWRMERTEWKKRVVTGLTAIFVICGITAAVQNEELASRLKLYPFLFTPTAMYERNGFCVTYLMDMQYLAIHRPEGYSVELAEQILSDAAQMDTQELTQRPTVIVMMDEAFSDPAVLGELQTDRDYMPFVHGLMQGSENTVSGYLSVSVKGGNTANTEFEFLTGNTMAFLPAGSIPYQQYIRREVPSLASQFEGLGYETCALHPYRASGWNRDKVYPLLGFSNFLSQEDFQGATGVRGYVDDASCVRKLMELYEKKEKNKPGFYFCVTMQNHSPYTDGYEALNGNISVEGANNRALEEYLTLLEASDAAFEDLVDYFREQEEPVLLVFFGDHQPADSVVAGIGQDPEQTGLRYEVPYVIWANYDIPEKTNVSTSANYLAAQICNYGGIPTSDYQQFLLWLSEKYPVISAQHTGEEASKDIQEYQILQYYFLFEKERGQK